MKRPNDRTGAQTANKRGILSVWPKARDRSLKRNIPFDIDREYVKSLFEDQNGSCYYSGIPLNIVKNDENVRIDPFKMTLDCIDPSSGYVKGNVVWCAYCVNSLKQKMSDKDLLRVCTAVVNNYSCSK